MLRKIVSQCDILQYQGGNEGEGWVTAMLQFHEKNHNEITAVLSALAEKYFSFCRNLWRRPAGSDGPQSPTHADKASIDQAALTEREHAKKCATRMHLVVVARRRLDALRSTDIDEKRYFSFEKSSKKMLNLIKARVRDLRTLCQNAIDRNELDKASDLCILIQSMMPLQDAFAKQDGATLKDIVDSLQDQLAKRSSVSPCHLHCMVGLTLLNPSLCTLEGTCHDSSELLGAETCGFLQDQRNYDKQQESARLPQSAPPLG